MKNGELVNELSDILKNGDGGRLIEFMCDYGNRVVTLMDVGALYLSYRPDEEDEDD